MKRWEKGNGKYGEEGWSEESEEGSEERVEKTDWRRMERGGREVRRGRRKKIDRGAKIAANVCI
jgi:hypothetical protein